jgi:hypothetical protein
MQTYTAPEQEKQTIRHTRKGKEKKKRRSKGLCHGSKAGMGMSQKRGQWG